MNFFSNEPKVITSGSYNVSNDKFTCNCLDKGECFALYEYELTPQKSHVYECSFEKIEAENGEFGIVFGVTNLENTPEIWHSATIDFNRKLVWLSCFCYGRIWRLRKNLSVDELALNSFKLRVEIVGQEISLYFNDSYLFSKRSKEYIGGNIGFYARDSHVEFLNYKYIEAVLPSKTHILCEGANFIKANDYVDFDYTVTVPKEQDSITLSVNVEDGYQALIKNSIVSDCEKITIPLHYGSQIITVVTKEVVTGIICNTHIHISREFDDADVYNCEYRPSLHFTPKVNWLNDPNGLMYNANTKEYHLFYQYNPYSYDWGNMSWGHAVSKDLISWEEKTVAMLPDKLGTIFSGCGVIDKNNTSGLFDDTVLPDSRMVALYTYDSGDIEHGWQNIALAYSKDNGNSWIKYQNGEPVIINPKNKYSTDFRDPKVIWIDDAQSSKGGKWLMVVAGGRARIFTSDNLIDWEHQNDLFVLNDNGNMVPLHSECPELYPLTVENTGDIKWIYNGGGKFMVVGDLFKDESGKYNFKPETTKIPVVNKNSKVYATQTFFNDPQNRRLQMSWIQDTRSANVLNKQGKVWNGLMSIPQELKLIKTADSYALTVTPIKEIEQYRDHTLLEINSVVLSENSGNIFEYFNSNKMEIVASFDLGTASEIGMNFCMNDNGDGVLIKYDALKQELVLDKSKTHIEGRKLCHEVEIMPCELDDNILKLHIILDVSAIDIYANDGIVNTTAAFYNESENFNSEFYVKGGTAIIKNMAVYGLKNTNKDRR